MFGNLGTVWAEMGLDTTKLDMGVTRAAASFKTLQGHEASLTKVMKGAAIGIGMVGAAIAAGAVKLAADYDKNMRKVWSLTEESEATFKRWKSEVLELAGDLPQSAAQMADAFYWIKSDMPDATDAQQMKTLEIAAKGAVGGVAELSETTNALVQAQNAYNELDPAKYMDIMNKAVERGSIELKDFVAFQGQVVGSAAQAKIPFEEVAAAVATLTRKAVPAETAFMALNNTIMGYLRPTDEAAETAQKYGVELSMATLKSKGLAGAMMEISEKIPEDELARLFPNIRALRAVLPLAGLGAQDFAADLAAMGAAAGTTDRMYEKNANTIENKWKIAVGKAEGALIKMGDKALPAVSNFLDKISNALDGNNEAFNKFASVLGTVAKGAWNLADALVKLWPLVIAGGAAFAAWKVAPILQSINAAAGASGMLKSVMANLSVGFVTSGKALGGSVMSAENFATSLGTIGLFAVPAAIGVAAVVKGLKDTDQAAEQAWTSMREYDKTAADNGVTLKTLFGRYKELQGVLADTSRSEEEHVQASEQLKAVKAEIAQKFPEVVAGFDSERQAILQSDDILQKHIDNLLKYRTIDMGGAPDLKPGENFEQISQQMDEISSKRPAVTGAMNAVVEEMRKLGETTGIEMNLDQFWHDLATNPDEAKKAAEEYFNFLKGSGQLPGMGLGERLGWVEPGALGGAQRAMESFNQSINNAGGSLSDLDSLAAEGKATIMGLSGSLLQAAADAGTAGQQIPTFIAQALASSDTQFQQLGVQSFSAYIQGLSQGQIAPDLANQIAQQMFNEGTFTSTGVAAVDGALTAMEGQLRSSRLDQATKDLAESMNKMFYLGKGQQQTQNVSVKISDGGSGASTKKSLDQVKASATELGRQKPKVTAAANTAQANATLMRLVNRIQSYDGQTLATVNIRAQIVGSGPFTADEYARYLETTIGGAAPTLTVGASLAGGSGGDMVSELQAAMNAVGTLAGWSTSRMSPLGDMSIEDWNHMNEAIASLGGNVEANLTSWWNMNGALIKAKTSMEGYQTAIEVAEKSIEKLQNRENALNKELSEHKNRLSELSQMKLKGEGAADDKSFAAQHELNRLQVELLKAQKEGRFNDAARIAADKRKLEKDKELLDAQTTYQFEAQKRAIEKALDPMKGQEMTQQELIKAIRTEQKAIADKEKQIARVQAVLEKERLKVAQLRDQYDKISKTVQAFTTKINEMARNFLDQYQKMIAAQEELNRKMAEGGDLGGGNLGVSPNRTIASARATTNISSTSMSSSADINIYGDVVITNPVGDMTDMKHELRMANLRSRA